MNTRINDSTLVAYALNELDDLERSEVEKALETDEDARKRLAELQAAAHLASEAFQEAPVHTLENSQREKILRTARTAVSSTNATRPFSKKKNTWSPLKKWVLAGAAACLVVIIAGTAWFSGSARTGRLSYNWGLFHQQPVQQEAICADFYSSTDSKNGVILDKFVPYSEQLKSLGYIDSKLGVQNNDGDGLRGAGSMGGFGGGGGGGILQNVEVGGQIHDLFATADTTGQPSSEKPADDLPKPDRYLIKNADYLIEAVDPKQASAQFIASVTAAGGYVANQQESIDTLGRVNILLQVRVPADKLDGTLDGIQALGRVLNKQVSTEDVTEEYMDTDSRIRNLKKTEERLLDHLSKSMLMEGTLKIEQELTRVREQLERLEGRLKYLSHRVDFSTITVRFQEKPKAERILPPKSFSSGQVASEAVRSLFGFAQALWSKIIWLGIWSPVWGTVLFLFWLVWRFIRMRRS
ncbi:MAG TPA: DUF4349 domain-containing protein [Candidatus Hydrogenedentes bacterium]|nr:DUF4349 domain-containing protein [Candidatus Hydrogenedentota bacterium]